MERCCVIGSCCDRIRAAEPRGCRVPTLPVPCPDAHGRCSSAEQNPIGLRLVSRSLCSGSQSSLETTHWSALCAVGKTTSHVEPGWTAQILEQDCNFPTTKTLGLEEMRVRVSTIRKLRMTLVCLGFFGLRFSKPTYRPGRKQLFPSQENSWDTGKSSVPKAT